MSELQHRPDSGAAQTPAASSGQTPAWHDPDRREQFRLAKLSLFNWGTFAGLHEVPVAPDGFLIVGRSGSGKSTLLDAYTALLIPPRWTSFNAAAREGDRSRTDRNLVTYVRGAWADQSSADTGEIASRTLRAGTTWSALAAEYADGDGSVVTLVQVFWLRGSGNATQDLRRHYMIADRPFDLRRELAGFAEDLDLRGLKRDLPDVSHFSEYARYGERLRMLLRIDSEMALKLLHKTQSAKNLGDLNSFLREFMLDPPRTFEVADRLVEEFGELDQAHRAVVTAREQIEVLTPARAAHAAHEETEQQLVDLDRQLHAIDPYLKQRRRALLEADLARLDSEDRALADRETAQQARVDQEHTQLERLRERHHAQGGGRIEQLTRDIAQAERERERRLGTRQEAERLCRNLDWTLPESPEGLAALTDRARDIVERWQQQQDETEQERDGVRDRHKAVVAELDEAEAELAALLRQPSNIPARMLALRAQIADGLGLAEEALPFVGELVQVRPEAAEWRGAIERVLHNFALSLIVDERHYGAVSRIINETHLGQRLVYHRVEREAPRTTRRLGPDSLVAKLELKTSPYRDWLFDELSRRFDYQCAASLSAFRGAERAVTLAGQVKHNRGRHEKDDRHRIDDQKRWVLGFDNRDKLALFRQTVERLQAERTKLDGQLKALAARRDQAGQQALSCRQLMNLRWEDLDVAAQLRLIDGLQAELRALRDANHDLAELGRQIEAAKAALREAETALAELRGQRADIGRRRNAHNLALAELDRELAEVTIEPAPLEALTARFEAPQAALTLANLDSRARHVERELREERSAAEQARNQHARVMERQFGAFKRGWPMAAGDLDETLASAPEYLKLLTRIEQDGLPRFEERFAALLKDQSTENLAALNRHVDETRRQIRERMALVNDGLAEAEFNTGTHLQIQVSERQLPDVLTFREQVRAVLEHVWTAALDTADAEARFKTLSGIVARLAGQEPDDKRWRQQVLDVRLHVEFIGRELDADGREVEVYRSGAGKSGGQREKLATTCLAAALRYQLGGSDRHGDGGLPLYAPVILDEAFGKADNEFTELAMRIFERFGFQMIVATPLKSVMTLEPFIGGACFVDIRDRKHSTTLQIAYDHERKRLALPERRAQGPSPQPADAEAPEPAQTWATAPAPTDDPPPAPLPGAEHPHERRDGRLRSA
ncbi:ATP-binding protein [Thiohalocapsa halophila]|uniref:ATP-binding protein n=1 Tax=Thiohalocapsa halophila TaxID=69359 RepID=A0ABS1CMY5_9GAMM|nr:SbcC/MukB-like Walker B domain-containing protein [Thiohalocapsa halophila]MBK1633304.1 ATP-binding protein [Thiohalocapsa halophila]